MLDEKQDYINWDKHKDSRWAKVSKQIKPIHVIGFGFLIFFGQYFTSEGRIKPSFFLGIVITFVVLILFLIYREPTETKLIPEHIIKQIAYESLENKRREGREIPFDAKIRVTLVGEGIWEQDMISRTSGLIRRDVGFEMIRKGYKTKGVIGIHPYSGIILGIRWEKLGYTGKETKDRTIIPVGVIDQYKP